MKKALLLAVVFVLAAGMLTGCDRKEHSEYPDNNVEVPATHAAYSVPPLSFRFEAGWTSANYDSVQDQMDYLSPSVGISPNICIFTRLQSPVTDQGTINYLDFGYFNIGHEVEMKEIQEMMEEMDQLSSGVKKLELSSNQLQSAKIRNYGEDEIEALTVCYKVSTSVNDYTLSCVEQIALIPNGTRVYVIIYSDFTTGADNNRLEEILTTLSFEE